MKGSISIQNVSKAYKSYPSRWWRLLELLPLIKSQHHISKLILDDVSFSVDSGSSLGILGINGAGKSTLLKIIAGTTYATSGEITLNGRVSALLELGMGFHPDFTGRENVYLSAQLQGYTSEQIDPKITNIEKFAEIGEYIDLPTRIYSSGMQMRLAFALATAWRPDILIVDEALAVGDAYFQSKCFKRINDFCDQGTTLLLVSHSAETIVKHCDQAIILKDGKILKHGPSKEVTNIYLEQLYSTTTLSRETSSDTTTDANLPEPVNTDLVDEYNSRPGYNPNEHRWGCGLASILDYNIVCRSNCNQAIIPSGETCEIQFKVHFHADFLCIVPGIIINTLEGIFLWGTNSLISDDSNSNISVIHDSIKVFSFKLPFNFATGDYLISLGISSKEESELIALDRRYDSIIVHVSNNSPSLGIISLPCSFETLA